MSTEENSNEIDYFRDSPLRYMGYSNEVGESFRSLVNVKVVHASYVVAFGYVFLDCADKMKKTYKTETSKLSETPMLNSAKTGLDCLVWQTSASVVIPGYTINRICKLSSFLMARSGIGALVRANKVLTTGIGLVSIPFIIHPIDHMCHYVMDKTLRPLLGHEPHIKN